MFDEFKKFALKGNVVDLAVGVIIGGAFGKIVTSLVNDVVMPLLSIITGGINLTALGWVIKEEAEGQAGLVLKYGQFLQNIVDFLIISFSIFIVIRMFNKFKRKEEPKAEEPKPEEPPKPSKEEQLLTEIRDLLKERR